MATDKIAASIYGKFARLGCRNWLPMPHGPACTMAFMAAGVGMLIRRVWFSIAPRLLKGIGAPQPEGARDKVIAMLLIFAFNIRYGTFFEQAGSSLAFLADRVVKCDLNGYLFPIAWFQCVNSIAIIVFLNDARTVVKLA